MLTDADLVSEARQGSAAAFRAIVERYRPAIYAIAFRLVGDRIVAEDITQETLLVAWRDLDELRETERLVGWLVGIARNLARRTLRRRARCATALHALEVAGRTARTPHDETLDSEEETLIVRALREIPDALRRPLLLYYLEGRSIREVAWDLMLSETAVKQRLLRGRNELRSFAATSSPRADRMVEWRPRCAR